MKKNKVLPFVAIQKDLEGIILSEISQRKINTLCYHLHVKSKNKEMQITKQK